MRKGRRGGKEGGAGIEEGGVRLELSVVLALVRQTLTAAATVDAVYKAPRWYWLREERHHRLNYIPSSLSSFPSSSSSTTTIHAHVRTRKRGLQHRLLQPHRLLLLCLCLSHQPRYRRCSPSSSSSSTSAYTNNGFLPSPLSSRRTRSLGWAFFLCSSFLADTSSSNSKSSSRGHAAAGAGAREGEVVLEDGPRDSQQGTGDPHDGGGGEMEEGCTRSWRRRGR